jgi:phospholipid/cholesterol/gamma-HCH transport system substrate-binding protein
MKDARLELKVGIFVAAGLLLLAVLVLSFSRGLTLFESTYKLHIVLPSAAGLKPTADVMISGVPIGKATGVELMPDERSVLVNVTILSKYKIRTNAVVHIDALGFLGDQYIEVTPSADQSAPFWQNDAVVQGETPVNMQAAVKSVSGLLDQFKIAAGGVTLALSNLNRTVLSDQRPPGGPRRGRLDPFQHSGGDHRHVQPAGFFRKAQPHGRRLGPSDRDQPAPVERNNSEFA